MTRQEFAAIVSYITLGIGKTLSADEAEVYFDLLGDLDYKVLQIAARRVLLEHRWATFPTIAELRAVASETSRGEISELSSSEAWRMAWTAAGRIDLEVEGSLQRACEHLPPIVVEAMNSFGMAALCGGEDPVGVIRGQFVKIFEQLSARDRRAALLPPGERKAIATFANDKRPEILSIAGMIGKCLDLDKPGVANG